MQPHDVLREAARMIETGGHSQGCHARDEAGNEVPLFVDTRGATEVDMSRARLGRATAYSLYGALAAAMQQYPTSPTAIWTVVRAEAEKVLEGRGIPGGTNHLHPVVMLNEHMDTTKDDAVAFLKACADKLDPAKVGAEAANG